MSNQEIELKFVVNGDVYGYLDSILSHQQVLSREDVMLDNLYFDTADLQLRSLDFGLRIRSVNGQHEQTIKLAGSSVGGLHQRPEYTTPRSNAWPDVAQFPAEIWPSAAIADSIQKGLMVLFHTDFHRRTWLVELDGAQIEVAYDIGVIAASGLQEPINEVELELKTGPVSALFALADILVNQPGWQLGCVSKAQRGYRLAGLLSDPDVRRMSLVPVQPEQTVEQALISALHYALRHWQFHEQLYLQQPSLGALLQLRSAANLILYSRELYAEVYAILTPEHWSADIEWIVNQLGWLDEALVLQRMQYEHRPILNSAPCQHALKQVIDAHEKALPVIEQTRQLLLSVRYARAILNLLSWLHLHQPLTADNSVLQKPLLPLALSELDRSWSELLQLSQLTKSLDHDSYQRLRWLLTRNLQVGVCFAGLFNVERQQGFRLPWLNLLGRLTDLEHFEWIGSVCDEVQCSDKSLLQNWLDEQLKPRLVELDQIRERGIEMQPYWQ